MAEVFAGVVCGYALALLTTPLLAITLLRLRASGGLLARLLPTGASALPVSVLLHGALFLFWTALGIVLGLVLLAMRGADGALGSANAPFSLFVAGLTLAVSAPVIIALPRLRRPALIGALLVLAVFGWLMPHMAGWTTFGSGEPVRERSDVYQAAGADRP